MISQEDIIALQVLERHNCACREAAVTLYKTIHELKVLFEELPAKLMEVV